MTSHIKIKLELNSSNMIEVLEAHQGDKNSRFIDIMLTSDGEILQIGDGITAKYDATIDNIVVADDVSAIVDVAENIITVELTENMLSMSGLLKIDLKILESNALITAQTLRVKVGKSVINNDSKFEPTGGTVKQFMDELASARGDYDNLGIALNSKADKATTLAGYGITDGENIGNKVVDKSKITDESANYPSIRYLYEYYYDYSEVDEALSGKLDNTSGTVKTDNIANKAVTNEKIANGAITALKIASGAVSGSNIAQYQISTNHLQNGAITTDKLADEVKTGINSKYDSSNVETGSGTLTPYTTSADIVKSADFTYQRVGRVVTVNVNIVFNAGTKSQVMFTNLPYVCKNTVNPRELCVSNSKVTRIWAINNNNTTLNIISDSSLSYAENETLAFTLSYLVS